MIVLQAGGLVVRRTDGGHAVLLVSSRRDPSVWVLPKGHIEAGESPEQTASREVREEAGIEGDVVGFVPGGARLDVMPTFTICLGARTASSVLTG